MTTIPEDAAENHRVMENDIIDNRSEIQDFFEGRSVLITGAGGYLGGILLEQLLRLCPGIAEIFILLREKKGCPPETRKDNILGKQTFWKIKEENPKVLEKVIVMSGELTKDDLGLNSTDIEKLKENVSVVFHCAASVSFRKPFSFMVMNNIIGTDNILKLSKEFPKIAVFVYTSTAFANSNVHVVTEQLAKMPFSIKKLVEEARAGNEEFMSDLGKKYGKKWPNEYCFSKAIAENLVVENAGGIPVTIVKPSIISYVWRGSLPGYIEQGTAFADITIGAMLGFLHVVILDEEKVVDTIPPDVVANTLIIAGWTVATKKVDKALIINCISTNTVSITWGELFGEFEKIFSYCLSPLTFRNPCCTAVRNITLYRLLSFLLHHIPAHLIDFYLRMKGQKPRFLKGYQQIDKSITDVAHFTLKDFEYKSNNFESLKLYTTETDKKIFFTDLTTYSVTHCMKFIGINKLFQFKNDDGSLKMERVRYAQRAIIITQVYKCFLVILFTGIAWLLLKLLSSVLM